GWCSIPSRPPSPTRPTAAHTRAPTVLVAEGGSFTIVATRRPEQYSHGNLNTVTIRILDNALVVAVTRPARIIEYGVAIGAQTGSERVHGFDRTRGQRQNDIASELGQRIIARG